MFRDLREASETDVYTFDICIVGAGAAGIALAMELIGTPHKVVVLEAGGFDFDPDVQDIYRGVSVGLPYADLDTSRLRFFGGTTNHWAGYCSPIWAASFDKQPWVPYSGWPIGQTDISPYYDRARDLLKLEARGWDAAGGWDPEVVADSFGHPPFELDENASEPRAYVINPVRIAEVFREDIAQSENLTVFLNANLVEILVNEGANTVTGLDIRTLEGKKYVFTAKRYVLAAGGIENARLMLSSDSVIAQGVGNQSDNVGRYFSDHLDISAGSIVPADRGIDLQRYTRLPYGRESEAVIVNDLTLETQRQHELTSGHVRLRPIKDESTGARTLRQARRAVKRDGLGALGEHVGKVLSAAGDISEDAAAYLWYGQTPLKRIDVQFNLDAAPNPDSRVYLGDETDRLGMRRVVLDWQLSEIDTRTITWMNDWIASRVAVTGLGRFRLEVDPDAVLESVVWHYHNISTTRMADDPKAGVVDANCKVFGLSNLFVTGSSVFSTCGGGAPTFTIVAFAIRLADHLKKEAGK